MTKKEFEEMKAKNEIFINEFIDLCKKHNLGIECEDPYCGLEIVPFNEVESYYCDNGSFGRWNYENIEKKIET